MNLIALALCGLLAFGSAEFDDAGTKVVGGHNAELGQFPYMASLRSDNQHFCGGSIISSKTILTAAHCKIGSIVQMTAVVGSINLAGNGVAHRVSRFIMHEGYNEETLQHDIGVVILVMDIIFTDVIQPIGLPRYDIGDGVSVNATGWGLTSYPGTPSNKLQYLSVRTLSRQTCQKMHVNGTIYSSQICTLSRAGEGVCTGDSGGPIANNNQVHGLASYAYKCAIGLPDFFTRVNSYKAWIKQNMV